MFSYIFTFIVLFILALLCFFSYLEITKYLDGIEKFITNRENNDPDKDGKMDFSYIYNPNYNANILDKYYLDDDIKINGNRLVYHPLQFKQPNHYTTRTGYNYWGAYVIKDYGSYYGYYPNVTESNKYYKTTGMRL